MSRAAVEGWITLEQAKKLFACAGQDFEKAKTAAATRAFKPLPLGATASVTLRNTMRTIDSQNVVGKIEGSDPVLKNEYVIYTSHWDHFGIGVPVNGDAVYHGAVDNATGIGGMIELARAFAAMQVAPKRSILMLAVTAEEQGLLGSGYYAANPLYPLAKTIGVVNMDALNVLREDERHHHHRPGQLRTGRPGEAGGRGAGQGDSGGPGTGEGRVLSFGSLPLCAAGRARVGERRRHRLCRETCRLGQGALGRVHGERLPQAV